MTDLWSLPKTATLGGRTFSIRWDWRTAMRILALLGDGSRPEWARWYGAVALFYEEPVPDELLGEAAAFLTEFLQAGETASPGLRLFDWQADATEIIADINRVAGLEVRNTDVHWWTFLAWFHAIGEGRLSMLVGLRSKLARGEKLTAAEQEFYRRNRDRVRLTRPDDPEKARLEAMLK